MKILLVYARAGVGGIESWMVNHATALAARGHAAQLFFFRPGPLSASPPTGLSLRVGTLAELLLLLRDRAIDIVHCASADYDLGLRAAHRFAAAKLIVTDHGSLTWGWHAGTCDALVGVSDWTAAGQTAQTDLSVPTIVNGIDLARFSPGPAAETGPPIVAWVGRSVDLSAKRIDRFAEVAPALAESGCRIWVVDPNGPAAVPEPWRGRLAAVAERWCGASAETMPEVYRAIAASGGLVLSTSDSEGLPLALLEAQACGCPVLGPAVPGIAQCVSAASGGVLYPATATTAEIVVWVTGTLADPAGLADRRASLPNAVRSRFGLAAMTGRYLQLYESAPSGPIRPLADRLKHGPLAPWMDYPGYIRRRWSAASAYLAAAAELAARGERAASRKLAALAGREPINLVARRERLRLWGAILHPKSAAAPDLRQHVSSLAGPAGSGYSSGAVARDGVTGYDE